MKKFLSDVLVECNLTVSGSTTLGSASGVTVSTSDNSTALATTAFVKAQGYVSTRDYISGVALNGNSLDFTGVGLAFNGSIDLSQILAASDRVVIDVRNESGGTLSKGTPVVVTGTQGATDIFLIAAADAADSALMPAIGVLETDLANNATGTAITGGALLHFTTDPIDGVTPVSNQTVYVKPGGGLTLTKPVGANLIQNIGKVGKVSGGNSGSMLVSSIMRTNDVPNLSQGKIWVGSAANTVESTTIHLDEVNNRLGIGTTSPSQKLEVAGTVKATSFIGNAGVPVKLIVDNGTLNDSTELRTGGGQFKLYSGRTGGSHQKFVFATGDNYTSGATRMTISNGGIVSINNNGEEGWSGNKLNVGSTSDGANGINILTSTTGNGYIIFSDASDNSSAEYANQIRYSHTDNFLAIQTVGTERLRIHSTGTVSIGTTAAYTTGGTSKLTVSGIVSIGASNNDLSYIRRSGAGHYQWQTFNGGNSGILNIQPYGGTLVVGNDTSTSRGAVLTAVQHGNTETLNNTSVSDAAFAIMNSDPSYGLFGAVSTNGDALLQVRRISTNVKYNLNLQPHGGNVGIGTTSPSQKLHVAGGDINLELGRNLRFSNQLAISKANNGELNFYAGTNSTNGGFNFRTWDGSSYIEDALVIRNNRSVGIGTASPSKTLDVNGTARVGGELFFSHFDSFGANSRFRDDIRLYFGTSRVFNLHYDSNGDDLRIASGSSSIMTFDSNNNVGIGTSAPSSKLDVVGDISLTGSINLANGVILDHGAGDGDPAGTIIETFSSNVYIGAFLDFTIYNDDKSNMRSGTLQLVFNQGEVMFNEVNTMDIGDTTPCTLTATNNGGNVEVRFTTPDPTFHIKYHVRTL